MFYESIDLFYEPEKECYSITMGRNRSFSEMSLFQQAFLCGMLREKKPEKILEIGVAAGGTTAVILSCLKFLKSDAEMYSVDISLKWYRTEKRETGFVAKEFMDQIVGNVHHHFLLGQSIPYVIDQIGMQIDFLILDTTHSMPGELLDFLVCLPYLKDGCIVVLHDVIENHISSCDHQIATKLLFDLVQGKKWYMRDNDLDSFGFSNIAAFEVNNETRKYIYNVFSALGFPWFYMYAEEEEEKYLEIIERKYGEKYVEQLKNCLNLQKYTCIKKSINSHYRMEHEFLKEKWKRENTVFIYGGGYWAKIYTEYAKINHLTISGWVISDDQDMVIASDSLPVYRLEDLTYGPNECSFVLALDVRHFTQVRKNLIDKGYYKIL